MTELIVSAIGLLFVLLALTACSEEEAVQKAEVVRPVKTIKIGDASAMQKRWFSGRAKAALDKYIAAESEYKAEVRSHQANLIRTKLDLS